MNVDGFKAAKVPIVYYKGIALEKAIEQVFVDVDKAHKDGANIIILSDRGVDEYHVQIPALLAVSAVHQHLVKTKKRTTLSLILESGEPKMYIILQHYLVMVQVQSILIWHMIQSNRWLMKI